MPAINSRFYIKASDSPIFTKSYESIKTIIKRIYGKEIITVGTLDSEDINRELGRVTQNVSKYPYVSVTPTNLTNNPEGFNDFVLKKYGTSPLKAKDGYYYTYHLKPVKLTCTVSFFSQSLKDCIDFMSCWSYCEGADSLKLKTKAGNSIDIQYHIEPDLSFPTKDFTEGSPLKVITTLVIDTYVGEIYKSPEIKCARKDIQIVTGVDLDVEYPILKEHSIPINEAEIVDLSKIARDFYD